MLGEFQDENVQRFKKSANFCKKTRKILLNITNKKYVQYKQLSQLKIEKQFEEKSTYETTTKNWAKRKNPFQEIALLTKEKGKF